MILTKTRRYRGIPEPRPDLMPLYDTVAALKEVVETLTRQRGKPTDSAVTVEDLIDLGIITRNPENGTLTRAK